MRRIRLTPPGGPPTGRAASASPEIAEGQVVQRPQSHCAPWVLDGPVNGNAFRIHVETQLVPMLSRGDIVTMDNPGTETVHATIRGAGAHLLFLPP